MAAKTNSGREAFCQRIDSPIEAHQAHYQSATGARFQDLPVEILQHIYRDLSTVSSIRSLSLSCRHFYNGYASSQRLVIVRQVIERQFGPLDDVIQLVTLNSSQPVDAPRTPKFSMALAKQIVEKGLVANRWVELYPFLRWRTSSQNRRFLTKAEAFRLKRALYRFWIHAEASSMIFDNPRDNFDTIGSVRYRWLRTFSTHELRELEEVVDVLADMLRYDCCPSDSTIQHHYNHITPTRDLLDFGKHNKLSVSVSGKKRSIKDLLVHESWGSDIDVACDVDHLIRMSPAHLLHFRENCEGKAERLDYVDTVLVEWTKKEYGVYQVPGQLRWDLAKVLGERTDGERRGGGGRMMWITWENEKEQDEEEREWWVDFESPMVHVHA